MNDIFANTETMQENKHSVWISKRTFGVIPKPP